MSYMDLRVRGVDDGVWRQFKAAAALRGIPLGTLLTTIIREWLEKQGK